MDKVASIRTQLYHFCDMREDKIYIRVEALDDNSKTIERTKCGSYLTKKTLKDIVKEHNLERYNLSVKSFLNLSKIKELLGDDLYEKVIEDVNFYARKSMKNCISRVPKGNNIAKLITDNIDKGIKIENGGIVFTIVAAEKTGLTECLYQCVENRNANLKSNNKIDPQQFIYVILCLIANLMTISKSIHGFSKSNNAPSLLGRYSDDKYYRYARILIDEENIKLIEQ